MKAKLLYTKSALPFILEALNIKTDIPHNKILGFYKTKDNSTKIVTNIFELLEIK